jgi:hypothetical protein
MVLGGCKDYRKVKIKCTGMKPLGRGITVSDRYTTIESVFNWSPRTKAPKWIRKYVFDVNHLSIGNNNVISSEE